MIQKAAVHLRHLVQHRAGSIEPLWREVRSWSDRGSGRSSGTRQEPRTSLRFLTGEPATRCDYVPSNYAEPRDDVGGPSVIPAAAGAAGPWRHRRHRSPASSTPPASGASACSPFVETVFPPIPSELILPLAGCTGGQRQHERRPARGHGHARRLRGRPGALLAGRGARPRAQHPLAVGRLPLVDHEDFDSAAGWFPPPRPVGGLLRALSSPGCGASSRCPRAPTG